MTPYDGGIILRVFILGGFLGAGKTSAIRQAARYLADRGEQVAIITNDQGELLVDTLLCQGAAPIVQEIVGGCFCCLYSNFEDALFTARRRGASVVLAEAVGSCADLISTVVSPLSETLGNILRIEPLTILVDPWRLLDVRNGKFSPDVCYLFLKQIEEADIIALTRSDLCPPDVEPLVREIAPDTTILRISGVTGDGVAMWLTSKPESLATPLDIDYGRYASAEAQLGWANGRAILSSNNAFSPHSVIKQFFHNIADIHVAHIKIAVEGPAGIIGWANLVRQDSSPNIAVQGLPDSTTTLSFIINARAPIAPRELEYRLVHALARALPSGEVSWHKLISFAPAPPTPRHRHYSRSVSVSL